jgi:Protein of unknown function (DUF1311).
MRHLYTQNFCIVITVLVTNFAVAFHACGQANSGELPADCSAYLSVPLPLEAEKAVVPKTPPACASYRSYRGIGRSLNYSEARTCAWKERLAQKADLGQNQNEPAAWVVGGSLILADIYLNGAGVKSNFPLAMRFACESEERMAMLALPEIKKLDGNHRAQGLFEFCDYAATTFSMNFCSGYASEIEDNRRIRYFNSLKSSLPQEQRTAFEKLLAAQNAYIEAHALEVYQGGTIRAIRTIGSQEILNNLFHTELVHFEHRKWPALSENQVAQADDALKREYKKKLQQAQTQTKEAIDDGVVTASHLSSAQEAWYTYREAWVTFARLRYPAAADAIRAQVTVDRYQLLKTLFDYE